MKASILRTQGNRYESTNDSSLNIQTWGEKNDYPQRCIEISGASGTGKSCLKIYAKFIQGSGFVDEAFYKAVINTLNQTTDYILTQVAKDYANFGGFALHINYNANFKIVEVQHVPFEQIRFKALDSKTGEFNQLAVHPDWGLRYQSLRRFNKKDIKFYDFFNPDPIAIAEQVNKVEGWESYNGQILYYSEAGEKTYTTPIYDSVLTDMNTEDGVSNVKNRNAKNNFLPSGMVIRKLDKFQDKKQEGEFEKTFMEFQTDENACKLLVIELDLEEEAPDFKPMDVKNYDKEFDYSEKSVQQNIGRVFNQPPILRAEDVGANFGADLITNAYNFYNSITSVERTNIERVFALLFSYWVDESINPSKDYSIKPLNYEVVLSMSNIPEAALAVMTKNEIRGIYRLPELKDKENDKTTLAQTIGVGGVQALTQIVENETLTPEQKQQELLLLFDLTFEQTEKLVNK